MTLMLPQRTSDPKRTYLPPCRGVLQRASAFGGDAPERARQPQTGRGGGVPAAVFDVLRSSGQALDVGLRGQMERRFGHDFSQVRVHADPRAADSARAVDAAAYAVGRDVVFGPGQFAPSTARGQKLLAHELAHVVQQGGRKVSLSEGLTLGAKDDAHETQADRAAERAIGGRGSPVVDATPDAVLRRKPLPGDAPLAAVPSNLPAASAELAADETISAGNPKLVDLAAAFRRAAGAGSSARISISASLSESTKMSSAAEQGERSRLIGRMRQIRDALQTLGVPKDRIDLGTPSAYSTSAHGQVSVDLQKGGSGLLLPPPGLPQRPVGTGPSPAFGTKPVPPTPASTGPSLSDLLTLKFGPVTIDLPKSIKAKLPIPISAAKSLVIELQADAPAKFSFKLTLDGTPYVRVSASAGAEYDTSKKVAIGSVGLQIESVATICHATNPEETRSKIKSAGDKLMTASHEYSAATDADTKQSKLIDIAGAIGEMYSAVDKAKGACKQVPRWKLEFGVKGPLGTSDETDPSKRPPTTLGPTLTIPF